jgi:hypothetical protein
MGRDRRRLVQIRADVRFAAEVDLPGAVPPADPDVVDAVAVEVAARGLRRVPVTAAERLAAVGLAASWGLSAGAQVRGTQQGQRVPAVVRAAAADADGGGEAA